MEKVHNFLGGYLPRLMWTFWLGKKIDNTPQTKIRKNLKCRQFWYCLTTLDKKLPEKSYQTNTLGQFQICPTPTFWIVDILICNAGPPLLDLFLHLKSFSFTFWKLCEQLCFIWMDANIIMNWHSKSNNGDSYKTVSCIGGALAI